MELKIIKNNLLIEFVIHEQMNEQTAREIMYKYKDYNILECKFQFKPNINLLEILDFGKLKHPRIEQLTIILE
jgi:hypothetical protein